MTSPEPSPDPSPPGLPGPDASVAFPAAASAADVNLPDIVAEVDAVFAEYEAALVGNDIPVLDRLFWVSSHTLRYGAGENLYGYDAICAFRQARPAGDLAREITARSITTFGRDFAVANIEFRRAGRRDIGRQSQTWVRRPEGWRVVSAHVSWMTSA